MCWGGEGGGGDTEGIGGTEIGTLVLLQIQSWQSTEKLFHKTSDIFVGNSVFTGTHCGATISGRGRDCAFECVH